MALEDAERLGLKHGDAVEVAVSGTSVQAHVVVTERMAPGAVFLIEGTAEGNANALLNGGPQTAEIRKAHA